MTKFHLITYGCKLNHADSEVMKSLLLAENFEETTLVEADFVIINTCGVVEKTERKILKQAEDLRKNNKKIILTGCLVSISEKICEQVADAVLGVGNIDAIVEAVQVISKNKKLKLIEDKKIDKALFQKKLKLDKTDISSVVAISEGCLGSCTYCASKLARKKIKSFKINNILKEIKEKIEFGFKEIHLTSQDLAVFGFDEKEHKLLLPQLLKSISEISGDFRIKLGMMNPGQTKVIFNDLLEIMKSDKFYKFLHIPIQSGSDSVLKNMKRGYKAADVIDLTKRFRKEFPDGILATDIIVGHPTETDDDFQNTVKLINKIQPDVLHVFKFSKRKGTEDYDLKDYPDRIKKDRSRILNNIFKKYNLKNNKKLIKTEQEILVVKKNKESFLGRTSNGQAIVLKKAIIGDFIKVKIVDCKWNYLIGEVIKA